MSTTRTSHVNNNYKSCQQHVQIISTIIITKCQLHFQAMSTTIQSFYKNNILFNLSFSYFILTIFSTFSFLFSCCFSLFVSTCASSIGLAAGGEIGEPDSFAHPFRIITWRCRDIFSVSFFCILLVN